MVAMDSGADNGFFYAGQVMHFSSPFTVFLIYHKQLYECYNENHPYDNEEIKADFNELYRKMNGMALREMDKIIYPVCKLCRDHEKAGFIDGIKIGIRLVNELA